MIILGPLLGLQITISQSTFADLNPFFIASPIFFKFCFLVPNAITDGPAPLIVTPNAPNLNAFFFTTSNPGIICFLAGSTITSLTDFPIRVESLFKNPATIFAALERFVIESDSLIVFGITALETFVFFFGTLISGTPIQRARSFGASILTTLMGFRLTITKPPRIDAATLS